MTGVPIADLRSHYEALLDTHGVSPHAVQWSSKESQKQRFEALARYIEPTESVIDLGSGLGDALTYLRRDAGFVGLYRGLDLVPRFVDAARRSHADDPRASFEVFDVTRQPVPSADVIFASGLFNNHTAQSEQFLLTTIASMFESARRAIVFNALSTYVDYRDPDLHYTDPLAVFHYAKTNLTRRVILDHGYLVKEGVLPFEFLLVLYR